ncbi:MAG: transport ATPase [Moraxellaceae bacterium]|jgi:putative Mg2+ transporter-C (MgtC) family protein|nr:transport ATPase [Moraxellaceae bacterium]
MDHYLQLLLRLGVAALCGAVLGLNRGLKQKPAGLRTHALVAIGAAFAAWMVIDLGGGDPTSVSRIMQGAMTGVGFLGAGVILRDEARGRVEGLTTAASIWVATILGLGAGAGLYLECLLALLVTLLVLLVSARLQEQIMDLVSPRRQPRQARRRSETQVPEAAPDAARPREGRRP